MVVCVEQGCGDLKFSVIRGNAAKERYKLRKDKGKKHRERKIFFQENFSGNGRKSDKLEKRSSVKAVRNPMINVWLSSNSLQQHFLHLLLVCNKF